MGTAGSPRGRFVRAVERRSILLAELSAREMGHLDLDDALRLAELYALEGSPKFERAAVRLVARIGLERSDVGLPGLQAVAALLAALPAEPRRADAVRTLLHESGRGRRRVS